MDGLRLDHGVALGRERDDPASLPIRTQPLSHPRAHCTLNRPEFIVATAFGPTDPLSTEKGSTLHTQMT